MSADMSEVKRIIIHADKSLRFEFRNSDLEYAKNTVNAIGDLMGRFTALRKKIEAALLPSSEKSSPQP
jgi:hypothetical protein